MELLKKRKLQLLQKKYQVSNEIKRRYFLLTHPPVKRVTGCQACYIRKYSPL